MLRQVVIPGLLLGMLGLILIPVVVVVGSSQHPQPPDAVQIDILSLAVDR